MHVIQGFVALLWALTATVSLHAQTTTGSIFGDVTDSSGAVLAGAEVRIINPTTGISRETATINYGSYESAGLQPAESAVAVEFQGFRSMTRPGVILPIQGRLRIDFRMEPGAVTASVTVNDAAPLVHTGEHAIQSVIDNRQIHNLPLK